MIRKIIKIDEEKCNGCGLCAAACHEQAIAIENGKARLIRDDYCDGLGNCLPACPMNAISFEEREAAAYDEAAVEAAKLASKNTVSQGCPGTMSRMIEKRISPVSETVPMESELTHWPVQIKLAPIKEPFFHHANLLIAADCTAYAYGNFHQKFIRNHVALIGCPKLDEGDYSEKLTEILRNNEIKSVKVVRMEVPCCGGMENAVKTALQRSGKLIPWQVIVISTDGRILED